MTTTFPLPDLGEGLTESTIVTWHVSEGDEVALNQLLAEVETAKAVVDLPSPYAGRIAALHAGEGEVVAVGAPLVDFTLDDAPREPADGAPAESETTDDGARSGAETIDDGANGRQPTADAGHPPDDATALDAAPERHAVLVGYGPQAEGGTRPRRRARTFETVPYDGRSADEHQQATPRAMPPVRMLARQLGVDLRQVPGSGPDGLIRRADVEASAGRASADGHRVAHPASTYVPITGLRKHTARAMTESAFTAPHAAVHSTVDVTETLALLRRTESRPGSHRPTFLSLACRAVVLAARHTPAANAHFDADAGHIEQFGHLTLGIAVATDRGLVVAGVPDADTLDAGTLAEQIAGQAAKARSGSLTPAELSSSTLTVTNVGVLGVDGGIPILNPGESVIVALGAIRTRPWEHQGQVALREVVTFTVSFDHRVLDGAEAAAFLTDITDVLSDPAITLTR